MSTVFTPVFRAGYPNLFKAKKNELNGKDEFSVMAIFSKGTDLSKLKAAAQEAITKKWGTDKSKWPTNFRTPFRFHDEKAKVDEATGKIVFPQGMEAGGVFLSLKSAQRPGVVDAQVQPIISESDFYAGCFARASVRVYTYEHKGNRGVAFGLQNIQKVKEGDPLGSRTRAEDDFAPIEGAQAENGAVASATDLFG